MTTENLLTEWSRLLFESLADAGLRDVIVSPGSRSTPLVWGALSCPRLGVQSVVDERDAAFFALGQARITGLPAALVCTSGSAAANYFPAVVEAAMAHVPLLVLTADRPFELMDAGASQTIDQSKLYGGYVRRFAELGHPDGSDAALRAVRRRAAQCLLDAMSPTPGPVHLNVRARKPLEPALATSVAGRDLRHRVDALLATPIGRADPPRQTATDGQLEAVAEDVAVAERGLVVCGPLPVDVPGLSAALDHLAAVTGFPVFAEATSQLRLERPRDGAPLQHVGALDWLLRSRGVRECLRPDVVLQVGDSPVSGSFERLLGEHGSVRRHVLSAHGWPDPQGTARTVVRGDLVDSLGRLADRIARRRGPALERQRVFSEALLAADAAAWSAVDAVLGGEAGLTEGGAVRAMIDALPAGALLAIGNSLPVRHLDAFCRPGSTSGVSVVSQRGVAGIDGLVAGAAGAAEASGRPTLLVLGDVSALHDLGGFAVAAGATGPLVVAILNNDGGRIFEQLPLAQAGLDEGSLRFWTTPHGTRFEGLCRLFPIAYEAPRTIAGVRDAVAGALARPGCTVVEIAVPPSGARDQSRRVQELLETSLAKLLPALAAP